MKAVVSRAKLYLKKRQELIRKGMAELGIDAMLLTHPADLDYLTDFTGHDSIGIITAKDLVLVTDFRYTEQASIEASWLKVVLRENKMADALADTLVSLKVKKVGFETNFTTFGEIDGLTKALMEREKPDRGNGAAGGKGGRIDLVPVSDLLTSTRMIKDSTEVAIIRQAIDIAEESFEAVRHQFKVGQTENDIAALLVFEMRSRGASDSSFQPIIAAGANSSLPHYRPADVKTAKGEALLFDWGARYKGYCSDITRTLSIGRVNPKIKEIYKIVLEANLAAIEFLRPGVTSLQADTVARKLINDAGYEKQFGHGLGHGVGRDIHELPRLHKNAPELELRPGMIVTVEPGIYLPGIGGVRIEDDVLITHSGCEVLTSLDKSFEGSHIE